MIIGGCILTAVLGMIAFGSILGGVRLGVVGVLAGGMGGGLLAAIALIDRRTRVIREDVRKGTLESRAMTNIRPLLRSGPLDVDGWALPAETCERLVREIRARRPQTIVECGSGASTVLIASCLRTFDINGHIVSLDHEPKYAESTRERLHQEEVSEYATVLTTPLATVRIGERQLDWYDFDPKEHIESPVDVLLVDGPPWHVGVRARFPAVPILEEHLARDCFILLDDGDRDDERKIAGEWEAMLETHEAELSGTWKPFWTLTPYE